jgi:hypothetical protein
MKVLKQRWRSWLVVIALVQVTNTAANPVPNQAVGSPARNALRLNIDMATLTQHFIQPRIIPGWPVIRSETGPLRVAADSDCSLEASLPPPLLRLLPGGANQFPGGFNSRCGPSPFTAHPVCPLRGRKTIGELPESNPHENAFIAL